MPHFKTGGSKMLFIYILKVKSTALQKLNLVLNSKRVDGEQHDIRTLQHFLQLALSNGVV